MHLGIQLPGEQPVYFPDGESEEGLCNRKKTVRSTLMGYFQYNALHSGCHQYHYQDFSIHCTYNASTKVWAARESGVSIGCIYHYYSMMGEKYYLPMLLTVVRAATSYESLRTVHSVVHTTFKAACIAYGLLDDDEEWLWCFKEAAQFSSGRSLRTLFATTLLFGDVTNPPNLWQQFCTSISDDLHYALEHHETL